MAIDYDNLVGVATPWTLRNDPPGFGYAGGVQDILKAYNGLHHRTSKIRYDSYELLQEQITYLRSLKEELEKEEDLFFDMFNIRGKDKKENFRLLKEKIRQWNETGAKCLINDNSVGNEFYIGLQELKQYAVAAEITEQDWDSILNQTFEVANNEDIRRMIQDGANIANILNVILNKATFSTSAKSSLIENLTVSIDENGKIVVKSKKGNISPSMQLKIVKLLKEYLDDKSKKTKPNYDFKNAFKDFFQKMPITPKGKKCIMMALGDLSSVIDRYAFSSNDSQIKGFLGEVYNNAFLYYMADESPNKKDVLARISPTGTVRDLASQEIAIDTWLNGVGIQVKNYEKHKIMEKGFNVHDTYDASFFIRDVLQLNTDVGSIGDILLNFFTSFDYNQQYKGLTEQQKSTDAYKYFVATRAKMHGQMENTQYLTQTFMPYVTKILKIDRRFGTEENLFGAEDIYHNTFFNISGNYVPSSVVVQAILDAIEKKHDSDIVADSVRAHFSTKHSLSEQEKWHPYASNQTVNYVYSNRDNYVKATKISYSITLNIDKLVEGIII